MNRIEDEAASGLPKRQHKQATSLAASDNGFTNGSTGPSRAGIEFSVVSGDQAYFWSVLTLGRESTIEDSSESMVFVRSSAMHNSRSSAKLGSQ